MSKRPEISPREFAKAIEGPPIASIPFDPKMFGTAANNGQMIAGIISSGIMQSRGSEPVPN